MGLVNAVVPADQLDDEVDKWCAEIRERSPTAIAIAKRSFNADTEHLRAIGALGFEAVALFYGTEESKEGGRAFREKRPAEVPRTIRNEVPKKRGTTMNIPAQHRHHRQSAHLAGHRRQRVKPDGID